MVKTGGVAMKIQAATSTERKITTSMPDNLLYIVSDQEEHQRKVLEFKLVARE